MNTPRVRFALGERFDPTSDIGAWIQYAWLFLAACSVGYVLLIGKRFIDGLNALALEQTYIDSMFKEI